MKVGLEAMMLKRNLEGHLRRSWSSVERFHSSRPVVNTILFLLSVTLAPHACADRIVLSPGGNTLPEQTIRGEAVFGSGLADYGWLATSSADGIEMELSRFERSGLTKKQWAMGIEYPLPTLKGLPAISLGIRDLAGTGSEHGSIYVAATQAILLSTTQRHWVNRLSVSAGVGTGTIGGAFVGTEAQVTRRLTFDAEIYRRRPNFSASLTLIKSLQIKACSINGSPFYGFSYHVAL